MSACFCVTTAMMITMTIIIIFFVTISATNVAFSYRMFFFFYLALFFIRLTICIVLWIAFPMWFLPARRRIKAHRLVSWTCIFSFKSLTHTNPCLLCSPRSPKRSLFIRFSDKDCVQYAFRLCHMLCLTLLNLITLSRNICFSMYEFGSFPLCSFFQPSLLSPFRIQTPSPPYFYQGLQFLLFCKRERPIFTSVQNNKQQSRRFYTSISFSANVSVLNSTNSSPHLIC